MEGQQNWFNKTLANPAWWTQENQKLFGPNVQDALLMLGGGIAGPESAVGRVSKGVLGLSQSRRASEAAAAQRQQLMNLYQKLMQQFGIQGLAGQKSEMGYMPGDLFTGDWSKELRKGF